MTRRALAAVAVAAMMVTAGCGFLLGNESLHFASSQVTASDQAVSETNYEEVNVTTMNMTQSFTVANQTRNVSVTNHLAQYERQVDLPVMGSQRAAVFAAFSTPAVEIDLVDKSLNPIGDWSHRKIARQVSSQYEGIEINEKVGTSNVTALGAERNVSKFAGTAQLSGSNVDVYVHVTRFKHGDDYVAAIAVYPQRLDGEEENVVTLLEGLEHDTE